MTDEYELMSAKELSELRKEVDLLKKNPFGDSPDGKTLLQSIQDLTDSMNRLTKLFTEVEEEIVDEFEKTVSFNDRFQQLIDQNQKIAAGIVTVADMISSAEKVEHIIPDNSNKPEIKPLINKEEQPRFGINSPKQNVSQQSSNFDSHPLSVQNPLVQNMPENNNSSNQWQSISAVNEQQVPPLNPEPVGFHSNNVSPKESAQINPSQQININPQPPLNNQSLDSPSNPISGTSPLPFPEEYSPSSPLNPKPASSPSDQVIPPVQAPPLNQEPVNIPQPPSEHKKGLFGFLKK